MSVPKAMPALHALEIHAGPKALAHLREHGLRAQDIAIVAGAAGGPKGLILQALDQWLFGTWLPSAPRERTLIGASIGNGPDQSGRSAFSTRT